MNCVAERENNRLYEDDGKVFKVFNKNYSKRDVFTEAWIHSKVEVSGIRVPVLESVFQSDGHWVMQTRMPGGQSMYDSALSHPENKEQYLRLLVDLQTEIHTKKCPGITTLRAQLYERIQASDVDEEKKYDLLAVLDSAPKHNKLCHGNFDPTHIWLCDDGAYVLDWNHATQGNASADVARSYLWFCLRMPDWAEDYIDMFCEKTRTSKRYLRQWLPIVAGARLTKNRPEEKELLQTWIRQCDYQ